MNRISGINLCLIVQDTSIEKLVNVSIKVLQQTGLLHKAEEIRDKHRLPLSAYAKCYKMLQGVQRSQGLHTAGYCYFRYVYSHGR